MGAAFSDLGAGIGADVGSGVGVAKDKIGDLDDAGKDLESDFDGHTSKIGSAFKSLGESLGNFGIPFSGSLTKMGDKLDEAKSKGQGLKQVISDIGGATVVAGAAGLAAVGVEAVKMADNFDVAQSQLQVAIKNSGQSFKSVQPSIDATYGSMAQLGLNSTDAAGALQMLVTSTGNTKKAEGDLSIAADLARAKHISLSDATAILTKTLAGSTRGLTTLGVNIDVGSGKLKTIATDTTAYQKALGNLHLVDQQVADGTLKGAAAYSALLTAHEAVDTSSKKLQLDQGTIGKIMDTVKQKTQGAATAYGDTLAGQMSIASAQVHNLGTKFGEELIPKLLGAEHVVSDVVMWFGKHKMAAEALGIAIGTFLAGAVAVFSVNMAKGMVDSTKDAIGSLSKLAGVFTSTAAEAEASGATIDETVETTASVASEAGPEAGAGFDAMLGPIGLVLIAGTELATHWKQVSALLKDAWSGIESVAKDVWGAIKGVFDDGLNFLKSHVGTIAPIIATLLTGPIGGAAVLIATHWNTVKSETLSIWDDIVNFVESIPSRILGALSRLWRPMSRTSPGMLGAVSTTPWSAGSAR